MYGQRRAFLTKYVDKELNMCYNDGARVSKTRGRFSFLGLLSQPNHRGQSAPYQADSRPLPLTLAMTAKLDRGRFVMKEIKLTRGKVALVDDEDFEWLNQRKWHAQKSGNAWYAARCDCSGKRKRYVYMHRLILRPPIGKECDHSNGSGLDNRRANLRVVTRSQNMMNSRKGRGCSSKFKGVYWNRQAGKWHTQINVCGRKHYLGRFVGEKEAACAYNRAARQYFGAFARLNEITEEVCRVF